MPYRALTHNRIKHAINNADGTKFEPGSDVQKRAINSQNGVSNSGPVTRQKNANNSSNKQPSRQHNRTASINFLMSPNAYGQGTRVGAGGKTFSNYAPGQGKGFPNATPQTSVGSSNRFSRRAIARRAVTNLVNDGSPSSCECVLKQVKNSRGVFINYN
jgi:hypothetical protein